MKNFKQERMELYSYGLNINESFKENSILNLIKSEKTTIINLAFQLTALLLTLPIITILLFLLLKS